MERDDCNDGDRYEVQWVTSYGERKSEFVIGETAARRMLYSLMSRGYKARYRNLDK